MKGIIIILYPIGIVLLAVLGGLFYQSLATKVDDYRYPAIGKLIDIGGYKLHLHSKGKGGPAVILDAGLSGTSLGWTLVQEEASKFTQVCSYDRAGYAWSEESPTTRTSDCLVKELHTLLHEANIPAPYILVGHSFGGCNVLMFAHLYPEETLGIILVDSVHEDMLEALPIAPQGAFNHLIIKSFLAMTGVKRLKGPSPEIKQMFEPLPENIRNAYIAQMNKTSYTKTVSREMHSFNESLRQLRDSQVHLGNKPLIVITAGIVSDQEGEIWQDLQKELLSKSARSEQIIAEKSDHMINHHQPEVIVRAIREMTNDQPLQGF